MMPVTGLAADGHIVRDLTLDQVPAFLSGDPEHTFVWINAVRPSVAEIEEIGDACGVDPFLVRETARHHTRPMIHHAGRHLLLVVFGLHVKERAVEAAELRIVAGDRCLATIQETPIAVVAAVHAAWQDRSPDRQPAQVGQLVFAMLEAIIDSYYPIVDEIADEIETLDEAIFERFDPALQSAIFDVKKMLLTLRRIVAPQRDVLNTLVRRDDPLFDRELLPAFANLHALTLRLTDALDMYQDHLSSALDAHQSLVAHHLNVVVKRLTAFSIIMMSVTLVAAIYGMNFRRMPELDWAWGYPFSLALMLALGGGLALLFRRIDWL